MVPKELKFLLKLLGFPNYRAPLTKIQPTPNMKATERNSLCRRLCHQGFVASTMVITKFKIAPPGKSLLKLDPAGLLLKEDSLQVLQACAKGTISPQGTGIPRDKRQTIIQDLSQKGLIKVVEHRITEIWLTEQGQQYLLENYEGNSTSEHIHLKMLTDYLRLLRRFQGVTREQVQPAITEPQELVVTEKLLVAAGSKPTDAEILQLIQDLDNKLGTNNYLPIFHLRQQLQPQLSTEELDHALYRLQKQEQIELSALVHTQNYTPEQINAGINQRVGSKLFFIQVTVE
ncbi:MAG: hypothetical protein F6K47_27945 [Symploca sp. SIO2E6]|nr:hypothetical protein [Symploca sp. SIO2E6]